MNGEEVFREKCRESRWMKEGERLIESRDICVLLFRSNLVGLQARARA